MDRLDLSRSSPSIVFCFEQQLVLSHKLCSLTSIPLGTQPLPTPTTNILGTANISYLGIVPDIKSGENCPV